MKYMLPLIACILVASCKRYTCEDFKTGTYVYADTAHADQSFSRNVTGTQSFQIQKDGTWTTIEKEVGLQTERQIIDGKEIRTVYDIIWDGPCSYTIAFKSVNDPKYDFHNKYDSVRVSVLGIDGKSFDIQSRINGKQIRSSVIRVADTEVEVTDEMRP